MKIGNFDTDNKVFIIAEIGNNHEGDFGLALEMIDAAAEAGTNAVKFQTITPNRLVRPSDINRLAQLEKFSFKPDQFAKLKERADKNQVLFLSTPFDLEVLEWLDDLVPAFKISSGDNNFWPLIQRVAECAKPLMLSLGLGEIKQAIKLKSFIENNWLNKAIESPGLALLHCVVSYPTPDDQAFLGNIASIKQLQVTPGYSDHTIGTKAAELSVACGARIIEKHFTLDKHYSDFRDHKLSADPKDLKVLCSSVRHVEKLLGSSESFMQECEKGNKEAVRRSISTKHDMEAGQTVSFEDLCWLRPGDGLSPGLEDSVIGKKLGVPVAQGMPLMQEYFEN
jgi:N,N'-diacetyllegionaminate synthase